MNEFGLEFWFTLAIALILGTYVVYAWIKAGPSKEELSSPQWEVFTRWEDGKIIGYQVRWSKPDAKGRYLLARHYMVADEGSEGPSLTWCEHAAERDCEQMNRTGRRPELYDL